MNMKKLILAVFGSIFMLCGLHAQEAGSVLESQDPETKVSDARKDVWEGYGRFLNAGLSNTLSVDFVSKLGTIRDFDFNNGSGFFGLGSSYDAIRKVLMLVEHLEKQTDELSIQFLKNINSFYSMLFHKTLASADVRSDKDARDLLSFCDELYALGNSKINTVLTKVLLVLWLVNSSNDHYEDRKSKFASAIDALRVQALEINTTVLQASAENRSRLNAFFRLMNGSKVKEPMLKSNRWKKILITIVIVILVALIIAGVCWFIFVYKAEWQCWDKVSKLVLAPLKTKADELSIYLKGFFKPASEQIGDKLGKALNDAVDRLVLKFEDISQKLIKRVDDLSDAKIKTLRLEMDGIINTLKQEIEKDILPKMKETGKELITDGLKQVNVLSSNKIKEIVREMDDFRKKIKSDVEEEKILVLDKALLEVYETIAKAMESSYGKFALFSEEGVKNFKKNNEELKKRWEKEKEIVEKTRELEKKNNEKIEEKKDNIEKIEKKDEKINEKIIEKKDEKK